jgi:hypothetical protein
MKRVRAAAEGVTRLRLLKILLRLSGGATVIAFGAMLLPVDWMAAIHKAVGLGEFPRAAVVELRIQRRALRLSRCARIAHRARSRAVSAYRHIRCDAEHRFGLMLIAIGYAGMPWFWTLVEGPLIMAVGLVVAVLNRPSAG